MVPKGRECDQLYAVTSLFSPSTVAHLSFSVAGVDDFPLCCEVAEHVCQQKFLVLAPFGTFATYKNAVSIILYFLFCMSFFVVNLPGN